MGSSYFGEPNLGSGERSGGRKGKNSKNSKSNSNSSGNNNSEKPKQPQRGLGVAQLEKIRIQSQLGWSPNSVHHYSNHQVQDEMRIETGYSSSSSSFTYTAPSSTSYAFHPTHQPIMMGLSHELDGDSHPNGRWNMGNPNLETQHFIQPSMSLPFFNHNVEGPSEAKRKKERRHSTGSNNQSSESSELDLELRLSI